MTVTLEARSPCLLCGYQIRCFSFPSVRVNKRSLRQKPGNYMCWRPGICEECGTDNHHVVARVRYHLRPESVAEIDEYRRRRWVLAGSLDDLADRVAERKDETHGNG